MECAVCDDLIDSVNDRGKSIFRTKKFGVISTLVVRLGDTPLHRVGRSLNSCYPRNRSSLRLVPGLEDFYVA
jgi:hypothetical protein